MEKLDLGAARVVSGIVTWNRIGKPVSYSRTGIYAASENISVYLLPNQFPSKNTEKLIPYLVFNIMIAVVFFCAVKKFCYSTSPCILLIVE